MDRIEAHIDHEQPSGMMRMTFFAAKDCVPSDPSNIKSIADKKEVFRILILQ